MIQRLLHGQFPMESVGGFPWNEWAVSNGMTRRFHLEYAASVSKRDKVNVCTYADDFIVTGATKQLLENTVKPTVESFLRERGLTLSQEKTIITHIEEGFDFLGANIRKYNGKFITKLARDNVKKFLGDIRETIKRNRAVKAEYLILQLNRKIRGWANYHRHICAKETFNRCRRAIFIALWQWAKHRHPNKSSKWRRQRYFKTRGNRQWVFSTRVTKRNGYQINLDLDDISDTLIERHVKIRANATPYDPSYQQYFIKRLQSRNVR